MTDQALEQIRILIVDDEKGFVDVLSKRLARRNFEVTAAFNGDEAIRILRYHDFDIALLDLKMEGMDGIEVLKILKKMAPEVPVIMLTGHGSQVAADDGRKYGVADYLPKPYDFDKLIQKIRSIISKGGHNPG